MDIRYIGGSASTAQPRIAAAETSAAKNKGAPRVSSPSPTPGTNPAPEAPPRRPRLSLDFWAVLTSLALAALVWGGLVRRVPW